MFNHHQYEAPGERLLLIQMEHRPEYFSEHRHIVAYVVRRAHADVPSTTNPSSIRTYYDGANPVGYRTANWHVGCDKKNPLYVADLCIRAQIDAYARDEQKLCEGKPYGGDVRFRPYEVDHNNAPAMTNFFRRYDTFVQKMQLARIVPQQENDFFATCFLISVFLDLKKFVIRNPDSGTHGLHYPPAYKELGWEEAKAYVQHTMLDQFAVKKNEANRD